MLMKSLVGDADWKMMLFPRVTILSPVGLFPEVLRLDLLAAAGGIATHTAEVVTARPVPPGALFWGWAAHRWLEAPPWEPIPP